MKELSNSEDFVWYKRELDLSRKYDHLHSGEPEEYPCRVYSRFYDDPYGPYTYYHTFLYQKESVCEHCGNITITWPEVVDVEGY
jgi:hypothetical protein